MSATDGLAVLAGLGALAWINWYFFGSRAGPAVLAPATGGVQEVRVVVRGGYQPSQVRVQAGTPVRLVFDRQEDSSCSEEIVIPDFGVRRFLPAQTQTSVEFTPTREGSHEFTCGMGMLRGRLIVEEPS
jgi:plastocyanin domain-containing protein